VPPDKVKSISQPWHGYCSHQWGAGWGEDVFVYWLKLHRVSAGAEAVSVISACGFLSSVISGVRFSLMIFDTATLLLGTLSGLLQLDGDTSNMAALVIQWPGGGNIDASCGSVPVCDKWLGLVRA
jgi:hypothetical protein